MVTFCSTGATADRTTQPWKVTELNARRDRQRTIRRCRRKDLIKPQLWHKPIFLKTTKHHCVGMHSNTVLEWNWVYFETKVYGLFWKILKLPQVYLSQWIKVHFIPSRVYSGVWDSAFFPPRDREPSCSKTTSRSAYPFLVTASDTLIVS